ncbi:MAG: choice-of-anchor Q domain-containing protein, partial [Planctomycetota bacterium]
QQYSTIQAAIDDANEGDIVEISPGTYTGDGNRNIDFLGKAITVRSTDPNDPNTVAATIIDCNGTEGYPRVGFYFQNNEDANSILAGFTIINGNGAWGGAIRCRSCSPTIADCVAVGNQAGFGGGISCRYSNAIISNCTITANSAHGTETFSGQGGGIYCQNSSLIIANCSITGNSAEDYSFMGDSAAGGAIYCWSSDPVVANCAMMGNFAATTGGAIGCEDSRAAITNCTISSNAAGAQGGGIFNRNSEPNITNCVIWDNIAPSEAQIYNAEASSPSVSYSDVQGGYSGVGNIDADPCFVSAGYWADANDPNILVEPNDPNAVWIDGDYHLLPGSPCIDAGDPNYIAELDATDLDGNPRIVDGNSDGNSVVDMGAYEFFWPPIQVPMKFTPQAFNPGSKGKWVKAHFVLPEGFSVEDVDTYSPAKIIEPFEPDIESDHINVFVNDDGLVEIEAAFPRAGFCGVGIDGNSVEVTALGTLTSGQQFYGTDTIRIIDHHFECLADFASYWLQTDCGKPDWCGGFDLDQDGVVNSRDFALFDACCIEIIAQ